jgi:hypothetical protein
MASVSGGNFHFSSSAESVSGGSGGKASAGSLSLTSVAAFHATVGGGDANSAGFDSVNSPSAGGGLAGQSAASTEHVITTQSSGGNTIVHLPDGSSLTVVGSTHVDGNIFH